MSRTLEDLARRALSILNEVGAGQAGAPEDLDVARREIPGVLARLFESDITAFEVSEPIPDAMFTPIARFVALECAPDFAVQGDKMSELTGLVTLAERQLRLLKRGRPSYRDQCSEYF
jgi:hypothetical protein